MADITITYYITHGKDRIRRYESADVSALQSRLADSFPPGAGSWSWDAALEGMPRSC